MKHRLFIAIDIPSPEIVTLQSHLDKLHLPIVWEKPEKIHLTLNFLGSVPELEIPPLKKRLFQIAASYSSFQLTPTFLETFYNRHEQSVIYLSPSGDVSELKSLQSDLNQMLGVLHLPQQNRFTPHITIGELKKDDPIMTKKFLAQISDFEFSPLSPFIIDRIFLYESHLSRAGSHYQKLVSFSFKDPT